MSCAYPNCNKPCFQESNGTVHLYCGKFHASAAKNQTTGGQQPSQIKPPTGRAPPSQGPPVNFQAPLGPPPMAPPNSHGFNASMPPQTFGAPPLNSHSRAPSMPPQNPPPQFQQQIPPQNPPQFQQNPPPQFQQQNQPPQFQQQNQSPQSPSYSQNLDDKILKKIKKIEAKNDQILQLLQQQNTAIQFLVRAGSYSSPTHHTHQQTNGMMPRDRGDYDDPDLQGYPH